MALTTTIGGATSDSYVTIAEYQARAASFAWVLTGTEATQEAQLRKAATANDMSRAYIGYRLNSTQSREWPRTTIELVNGYSVPSDTIPQSIKDAQMEMAYLIQGGADPFATDTGTVKTVANEVGPIKERLEYRDGYSADRYPAVDWLLKPYLAYGAGQVRMARA